MNATLKQSKKILSIFEDVSAEKMQTIISSGLLSDLRDGDIGKIDRDAVRKLLCLDPLKTLKFISQARISASPGIFSANKKFVLDISQEAKVRIRTLGTRFREKFLDRIEQRRASTVLFYSDVNRNIRFNQIINELGERPKIKTTLYALFSLLEKQGHGETGALLVNRHENIFLIDNNYSETIAVSCRWHSLGWDIDALSYAYPFHDDYFVNSKTRIFSSNNIGM